jgi:hypothetical protein
MSRRAAQLARGIALKWRGSSHTHRLSGTRLSRPDLFYVAHASRLFFVRAGITANSLKQDMTT